jgi:predicted GIY-YIG superfamily endonuclease
MYKKYRHSIMCNHVIYVLRCVDNKYYVGKTIKSVSDRFAEHLASKTCAWTKLFKPLSVVDVFYSKTNFTEDNTTKEFMMKYGIDNVRGGSYSNVNLCDYQIRALNHEFLTFDDKCYSCHQSGHLSPRCPNTPKNKRKHCEFDFSEQIVNKKTKIDNISDNVVITKSEDVLKIIAKIELFFSIAGIEMKIDSIFNCDENVLSSKKNIIIIIMHELVKYYEESHFIEQNVIISRNDTDNFSDSDVKKNTIKILFVYEKLKK